MDGSLQPRKLFYLWVPVIFYGVFVFFMSSFSFHFSLFQTAEKNNGDKLAHVVEYSVLGFLLARALWHHSIFWRSARRVFWAALILGALYGVSDEFHQRFVPERDSSVFDLTADSLGVALGAWICIRKKKKSYA